MENFVETIYENCREISDKAIALESLSEAFRTTGNPEMCKILFTHASDLAIIRDSIRKAVNEDTNRQFAQAEQSSTNVVNSAMAGIELASKDKKEMAGLLNDVVDTWQNEGSLEMGNWFDAHYKRICELTGRKL